MTIINYRQKYIDKFISKVDYIEMMYQYHAHLFEYCKFIKDTEVAEIIINNDFLVVKLKNGVKFICNTPDKREAPFEILNFSFYEKNDSNMVFNLIEPNMIFFDIGANVGWYALNIAKRYESISIYAFEPISTTFNCLKNNVVYNKFKNIFAYNIGFSNEHKKLDFYFDPISSVSASLENLTEKHTTKKMLSNLHKIDDFFINERISHLDFIKCDVEGAELLVFQGAIKTLEKYKPIIFSELLRKWSRKFGYHPNEVIQLLVQLGYRSFYVENSRLIEITSIDEVTVQTNFLFLHSKKHLLHINKWCE
jgi:FkbM family methyltransferase